MQHFEYTVECLQRVRARLEARLELANTMQKLSPTGSANAYLQDALHLLSTQSGPSSGQPSKIYSRLVSFTPNASVDDFLTALESDTNSHHQSIVDEWEVNGSLARAHLCSALVERDGFQLRVLVYIPVDYPREESVLLLLVPLAAGSGKKVAVAGSGDYAKGIWVGGGIAADGCYAVVYMLTDSGAGALHELRSGAAAEHRHSPQPLPRPAGNGRVTTGPGVGDGLEKSRRQQT